MALHVPLMFRLCFFHVPFNVPFISLHVAACAHHVPPCSLHVPFLFFEPRQVFGQPFYQKEMARRHISKLLIKSAPCQSEVVMLTMVETELGQIVSG